MKSASEVSFINDDEYIRISELSNILNTWDFLPYKRTIELDKIDDGLSLGENVAGSIIGICVYALTSFVYSEDIKGLLTCVSGAKGVDHELGLVNEHFDIAKDLLSKIKGLDDDSIICACKLAYYYEYDLYNKYIHLTPHDIVIKEPNVNTISNIRKLVNRNLQYLKRCKHVKFSYSVNIINSKGLNILGYGDALLDECILDFKCLRGNIENRHLRQLLIYLWGLPEEKKNKITKIHIYNGRKNQLSYILLKDIPKDYLEGFFKAIDNFEGSTK